LETFEIRDEEIDVEEIMRKIRENIRMRREAGIYPEGEIEEIHLASGHHDQSSDDKPISLSAEARRDLDYINSSWDVENKGYFISSHRPVAGKFLVTGRELVHGEVRRYVDPAIWKQREFNASTTRLLNEVARSLEEIGGRRAKLDAALQEARSETIEERARREANAVISAYDLEIKSMDSLASILEGKLKDFEDIPLSSDAADHDGVNYFVFEEAFRGSRETIKERQAAFVRYFEGSKNVLDIGCGRGEFLELLRDSGIGGRGIDSNEDMVEFCRSRGLDVERIDAIAYLEGLEDKSLDGVFLDQVVEHLRPDYMVKLLGLCNKKMKYGHHIVVETVNPLSFTSLANFYIDLTHVRPVHPETLRFLFGVVGFREVEVRFFSLVPDEGRLKMVEQEEVDEESKNRFETIYNKNIAIMNSVLFGAQDYAAIGKK
jgi:O-antigen chain-terminating methyltransferase